MRGKKFEFTNEQIEYIIENWGKETPHSMKKKFGCSWYAISKVAESHGLETAPANDWTEEEIEKLKTLSETYHMEDIAIILNRTENAIYLKARRLGITLIQDRRKWTQEEEDYLYERWGRDPIEKIASSLKRSIFSVKVKATRMSLGYMSMSNIDQLSVRDISEVLNVRSERITDTWKKLGLKLRKKKVTQNYSYYCVTLESLLAFLKEHQDLWNSEHLEKNALGEEPEWLLEKRQKDKQEPIYEYRRWTSEEENLAVSLLMNGYDYEYISAKVNHSPQAVAYKLRSLGYSYRLKTFWKGSEIKFIRENYKNMTSEEMAEVLGRTTKGVQAKCEELRFSKKLKRK